MSTRLNLNIFLRDPTKRAVAMCLDLLIRMDPDAVATQKLQQATDREFEAVVKEAARFLWGRDPQGWSADVHTVLKPKRTAA